MLIDYHVLDVFTRERLTGNQLAVIPDAGALSTQQMQAIAYEFNLSETVFLLPATNPAHTARLRIFTPKRELPFAGHPTVGAAILLAKLGLGEINAEQDAIIVVEQDIGPLRIGVRLKPGEASFAEFDVPKLPVDAGAPAPEDRIAAALGLAPSEIGFENHHPTRYSAGLPFTFVPVEGIGAIRRARVVHSYWQEGFRGDDFGAAYLYCRETVRQRASFHARAFVPSQGFDEDSATGSAVAALAGAIYRFDRPGEGLYQAIVEQGFEMHRPSEIHLEIETAGRQMRVVRIGGYAVDVMRGQLELPPSW